jgi:hypothetical protein
MWRKVLPRRGMLPCFSFDVAFGVLTSPSGRALTAFCRGDFLGLCFIHVQGESKYEPGTGHSRLGWWHSLHHVNHNTPACVGQQLLSCALSYCQTSTSRPKSEALMTHAACILHTPISRCTQTYFGDLCPSWSMLLHPNLNSASPHWHSQYHTN